ncbi:MAG: phosphoglucosamine mutase [Eubacteriales bacterium]
MGILFGTDGIRGIAGEGLTAETAYRLGIAVADVLAPLVSRRPCVVIGRDTRISGDMLESACSAGLCAAGCDVTSLGIVPTPAVAYLVRTLGADAGIMISASHNPSEYNGIKVFGAEGFKLSDALEESVENIILSDSFIKNSPAVKGGSIGRISRPDGAADAYISHVSSILAETKCRSANRRRVLFDLANGSACACAKKIFTPEHMFGYAASFIADTPDGMNINDGCGSTKLDALASAVVRGGYDIGIAFDGDADRCLCVDEKGNIIDGDAIIAALALDMKRRGKLSGDTAVVTCLTNLGFHKLCKSSGISVSVTAVGDRSVLERMLEGGYSIGGEQSGHIIMTDYATTGDGEVTASKVLSLLCENADRPASQVFGEMVHMPQISKNVEVGHDKKNAVVEDAGVCEALRAAAEKLDGCGRVLVRPSGTEALVRIMLEGEDAAELERMAEDIAAAIKRALGE